MSNPQKDIFDLFKLREREWEELPPPAAWNKLEKRLDKHHQRIGMQVAKIWLVAVSILLVLSVITIYVILWTPPLPVDATIKSPNPTSPSNQDTMFNSTTFDWLLGTWYVHTTTEQTMERWQKKDKHTLMGAYHRITAKDTLLLRTMQLTKQGEKWCYKLQNHDLSPALYYYLVKADDDIFFFETQTAENKQQMILENKGQAGFLTLFTTIQGTSDSLKFSPFTRGHEGIRLFAR